jgi:hypothetical protein
VEVGWHCVVGVALVVEGHRGCTATIDVLSLSFSTLGDCLAPYDRFLF